MARGRLDGVDGRMVVVNDPTRAVLVKSEAIGWILQARIDVPGTRSP